MWRKLKRLGVAQISDGLVALPADARTREQLEWIAEEVTEAGISTSTSSAACSWAANPPEPEADPGPAELAERGPLAGAAPPPWSASRRSRRPRTSAAT